MLKMICFGFIAAIGCGTATLTPEAASVKLMKSDPPANCTEVGSVSAYRIGPSYQDKLKNALREDAAKKGGNYVRLESLTSDGNAAGTAYKCAEAAPAAVAAPAAPAAPAAAQ
jgi:hypothetical protein